MHTSSLLVSETACINMRKASCDHSHETNKGAWSKQEDQRLLDCILKHGEGCWRHLPKAADELVSGGGYVTGSAVPDEILLELLLGRAPFGLHRCGKSCRLRWMNHLKATAKRGKFGEDEEDLIIKLHALLGDRWSLIAGRLPGRTDDEVKNYWNSHIRKKLVNMGIDPNNHRVSCSYSRPHNSAGVTHSEAGKSRVTLPEKRRLEADDDEVSDAGSSNVD